VQSHDGSGTAPDVAKPPDETSPWESGRNIRTQRRGVKMGRAYLLTGEPRVGKTTALKTIIDTLGAERCGGFYTQELCAVGERYGFQLVTLDEQSGTLADIAYTNVPLKVGKYGVALEALEGIGLLAIYKALMSKQFIIIDEVGPMQLLSEKFRQTVIEVLDSPVPLIGTLFAGSHPWTDELKKRKSMKLYPLTLDSRDTVPQMVIQNLMQE
jgi:nucleoside-triphosphatase